jgi:hypothetical protein
MPSNTAADVFMQTMVNLANEKLAAGNYADAISSATSSIGSIADNTGRTRQVFGPLLVPLYSLRARSYWEVGQRGPEPEKLDLARQDVAQAQKALDEFYASGDMAKLRALRTQIDGLLAPAEKVRNDSLQAVLWATTHGSARPGRTGPTAPSAPFKMRSFQALAIYFGVGLVYWAVALGIMAGIFALLSAGHVAPSGSAAGVVAFVAIVLSCLPWFYGIQLSFEGLTGRRNMRSAQGAGLLLLAFTVIGFLPICYWTGRAIIRRFYGDL